VALIALGDSNFVVNLKESTCVKKILRKEVGADIISSEDLISHMNLLCRYRFPALG
jgi:hypothetical protein